MSTDSKQLAAELRQRSGLFLSAGAIYGGDGARFLRMNIACPRATVLDGLERLKKGLTEGM